jgi:hypothetical protein
MQRTTMIINTIENRTSSNDAASLMRLINTREFVECKTTHLHTTSDTAKSTHPVTTHKTN